MKTSNYTFLLLSLTVILGTTLLIGCGGSKPEPRVSATIPTTTGRATLTVRWPERSRLIPFASESIYVRLSRGTQLFGEKLLIRPANGGAVSATFDRVPTGAATVAAVALPNADGTGTAQAQGSVPVTVVANQTAQVSLTLGSTINRLAVAPVTATLGIGASVVAVATAYNAQNEMVLTRPATIIWASDKTNIVSVEAGGKLNGLAVGTATITATETESGKTATMAVTVTSAPTPTPTPTPTATPTPIPSGGPPPDATLNPANGHYYKVISAPNGITWTDARAAAQQMSGYLATITSAAENQFVFNLINNSVYWLDHPNGRFGPWLGGYQIPGSPEPAGGWTWVTGESFVYTAWSANQPDTLPGEDKLHYFVVPGASLAATWNDLPDHYSPDPIAYVVEWGAVSTDADLIAYEGFDYPLTSGLNGQTGGIGLSEQGWDENTAQGSTPTTIVAGLTYPGLATSGSAAQSTSLFPFGNRRQLQNSTGLTATGNVIYASLLIRPLDQMGLGWPDTYFGFGSPNLFVGGKSNGYVLETGGGSGQVNSGVVPQPNVTVFLVIRHTFRNGADIVDLWVNPVPGQPLPAPNATKTDLDIGEMSMGLGGSIRCIFDEYRIGRTWESVSPTQ